MSAAQKDPDRGQTTTLSEQDIPTRPITHDDMARMIGTVMDDRDKAAPPASSPLSPKQWTAVGTILTTVLGVFGGANYLGVAQLTAAEVTEQDEANRKVVREELKTVLVQVDKRVDADRAAFKAEIGDIKQDMAETKAAVARVESYILILKDRESRK